VGAVAFAHGRYRVFGLLGEGARKRVYRAHDTLLDREVAFALIKTDGLDAGGRERIRREAQAMGRLGSHPHVVAVFDLGEERGQPFIVTELLDGGDLESLLAGEPERRLPLPRVIEIGQALCRGLEFAHGHRIIHRDLKPGNVWLTADGTAKLGDFGLAVALDQARLTQAGMMVGTVSYMPPEPALGGEVTARSDLYALGAVLYEMVTGRPPFVGDESVAIITQHLNTAPVAPSWHRPDCPPALEALILRLLEKDPAQRPASAAEVGAALETALTPDPSPNAGRGEPSSVALSSAPPFPAREGGPGGLGPVYRRTFVGREAELKQLTEAFDAALSGQGSLVMVVGEPGIGKTSLCEHLATYAAVRGGRVLVGHCYEEGSLSLPYQPFVEALRSYVISRDDAELGRELGSGAADIARIVSEVRDRVQVEPPPPTDPQEERYRLLQSVSAFLRTASTVQPLVLVLEDLHDADQGTLEMLRHLARNLGGARLLVAGTYRDIEVDRAHPLSAALAELRRGGAFGRVLLRGLTADGVQRMMSAIAGQEVPWGLAEAVHRQTEGNPLFVQEVLRYIVEEGLVTREGGRWRATSSETPLAMAIPEGLRDVIGLRLSRLSTECNRLLAMAAVIGRDFALSTLEAVAGEPEESVEAALEEAVRVAVLTERERVGGVQYRFAHAFFRQTLYEELSAPRRIRLHQQVARALEAQYAARLAEHAGELAEHYAHSSDAADLAKAVEYGEMAAARARAVYAYSEAARLLEQALEVQEVLDPDDRAKRCDLLLALGEALMPAGEPRRASDEVAPAAFELAEAMDDRARAGHACRLALDALRRYGAIAVTFTPQYREWVEQFDRVAAAGTVDRVRADIALAEDATSPERRRRSWTLLQRALAQARELDDPETLFFAAFSMINRWGPPQYQQELLHLADEFTTRPREGVSARRVSTVLFMSGNAFLAWGERARAEDVWRQQADLASQTRDSTVLITPLIHEPWRVAIDGHLEAAVEGGERLRARSEELGAPLFGRQWAVTQTFRPLLLLGRAEEALAAVTAFYRDAGLESYRTIFSALVALAHACLGHRTEAQQILGEILADWGIGQAADEAPAHLHSFVLETAVLLEDWETAERVASRLAGLEPFMATGVCVARLLGNVAARRDRRAARAYYEQALAAAGKIANRPEIALTHLDLAELLLDEANAVRATHASPLQAEAMQHLDFAIGEFREMKMQPALERALRHKVRVQGIPSGLVTSSIDIVSAAVRHDPPDLRAHAAPDGTVTVMFTDIEDSTRLTERLGDARWLEVLREHNALVREQVAKHGGFEVKHQGDGFMVAFGSARQALACAIAVQRAFQAPTPGPSPNTGGGESNATAVDVISPSPNIGGGGQGEGAIRVRIGLHTGEALRDADDFFGHHVILAARIADRARGGEILVSGLLKELTESSGAFRFDAGQGVELKGLAGTHRVYSVTWV
jgi:serine/threonine protein kinase/class 3 adenylate cyclase